MQPTTESTPLVLLPTKLCKTPRTLPTSDFTPAGGSDVRKRISSAAVIKENLQKGGKKNNCKVENICWCILLWFTSWWFQPNWEKYESKWVHLPQVGVEIKKYLSCHHLVQRWLRGSQGNQNTKDIQRYPKHLPAAIRKPSISRFNHFWWPQRGGLRRSLAPTEVHLGAIPNGGSVWIYRDMWGFLKWWYPTTIGFPTKNDHFGVFWGYHHLRKHQCHELKKLKHKGYVVNNHA